MKSDTKSRKKPVDRVAPGSAAVKGTRVREKEREAVEIATKIAIEIHGPALKELEKH